MASPGDASGDDGAAGIEPSTSRESAIRTGPIAKTDTNSSATMVVLTILAALVALLGIEYAGGLGEASSLYDTGSQLPTQSVFVDPLSFNVIGTNGTFRNASQPYNPTGASPPFFQIFSRDFLDVLGPNPSIRLIAENATFAFAHEAPIWVPSTDEVFFASNDGGPLGMSDLDHNSQVSTINLTDPAISSGGLANYTKVPLSDDVQMNNGGTPFRGQNLLVTSGRGGLPPSLVLVNPRPPFNSTVLLDNFFGRQFNSLNDVKIHPTSKKIFFTDVAYGFLNHFRPLPQLPNQVYRFDPDTGSLRVVADGFDRCNGIAFSGDGKTAFITDTGESGGFLGNNQTEPATIYAFDVDPKTHAFKNRRVFAYVDNGVPDGIQVDLKGRVYSGTGDGVQVWSPDGELLGKFFLGTTSANMVFAGPGRLVILAETAIYLAHIAATGLPLETF
ncbi:D-lactonohydrolase-like protein [Sanghuangporus baumii]|uniref:D-lactonohydrolase-like protein n=1 Tax=Sanghuangporus baumii TaxID=108892 RepID=A0A9Q5I4U5_SANBA|nr:D-lactonohydrolase-like protein [Sanghuangporus baumii]